MNEFGDTKHKTISKDIKSFFLKKIIFSFLPEKQKLNLIIYNQELQKILSVGIKDYERVSGKYKVGEKNGKGREYYDNYNIKFEGEYLNGEKNGKGREYNSKATLIFEGEYLNGKKK